MKKFFALLLVFLLLASVSTAVAKVLDLSPIEAKSGLYTIDVSEDGDSAFIETTLSSEERSFTHQYESSKLYSTTLFDVLVVNYQKSTNYPIFRLWITYCADDAFQHFDAVTISLGNKRYTFTDVSDPEWLIEDEENGYIEDLLIRFGKDNVSFLKDLEEAIGNKTTLEQLEQMDVRAVLHGDEDIEIELGSNFLLDFLGMKSAWLTLEGLDYLDQIIGSDMSVTTVY
ncbi:MAG: hypothetical protein J6K73_13545 [Clostridia bacterium]|nr:hypothetical protein [Clostridia bacterium]